MKLHLAMLEKMIELPECNRKDPASSPLRHLLDDLGLEVKDVATDDHGRVVFNIETLANRGDHLYAIGVAREISARTLASIKLPPVAAQLVSKRSSMPVRRVTDKCLKYSLLELSIPPSMPLRSDVASVLPESGKHHAMVDLLNYVQLELGQPMHAFDHDKIEGEIVIDLLPQQDELEALDGKRYRVPAGSMVIRDKKKVVAIAGVIGCANSMVTETTRRVLVEAATFEPVSVRKTARAMGLSTDASYAFERGVDPEGIPLALKRVVYLAEGSSGAVGAGEAVHALGLTVAESIPIDVRKVRVKLSRIRSELNLLRLEEVEIAARLKNLGYHVEIGGGPKDREFTLTVPSWRTWDVFDSADVVEDVARSVSLSRVKQILPPLDYETAPADPVDDIMQRLEPVLVGNGFIEVITKGFYSKSDAELLSGLKKHALEEHVLLNNAIEVENSHMKITNVIHLARLAASNERTGVRHIKVFEVGRFFSKEADEKRPYRHERDVLTILAGSRWYDNEWRKDLPLEEKVQLFSGVLDQLIGSLGAKVTLQAGKNNFLHPGIQGSVKVGRTELGSFGVVHPAIIRNVDATEHLLYAEFDLDKLINLKVEKGIALPSDYPEVRRDITVRYPERQFASQIVRSIIDQNTPDLSEADVVDDFKRPDEAFRRLTLRLTFQSASRTLQHEEVDQSMQSIMLRLKEEAGVELA